MKTINILLTTPHGYAERLKKALKKTSESNCCIETISIPTITHNLCINGKGLSELITNSNHYTYILFCSRKAIDATRETIAVMKKQLSTSVKCVAIGIDAEYMTSELHVKNAMESTEPSPLSLINEIYQKEGEKVRIAIVGPEFIAIEEPFTIKQLKERVKQLHIVGDYINAYQTKMSGKRELIIKLIKNNLIDCITFTSGAEIFALIDALESNKMDSTDLNNIKIACYGPYTAKCAESLGLKPDFIGQQFYSFNDFAQQLKGYLYQLIKGEA